MALLMTSGPAVEPVSLAEAKAHLRIDGDADDLLVSSLITSSRLQIETALSIALVTQVWSYFIDALPASGAILLPLRPIQSLDFARLHQDDGGTTTIDTSTFTLDGLSNPPRLVQRQSWTINVAPRKTNAIEFSFTAGFGGTDESVPSPIRQALLQLVSHWYEHRDPSEVGSTAARIPIAVSQLLSPWQSPRLV